MIIDTENHSPKALLYLDIMTSLRGLHRRIPRTHQSVLNHNLLISQTLLKRLSWYLFTPKPQLDFFKFFVSLRSFNDEPHYRIAIAEEMHIKDLDSFRLGQHRESKQIFCSTLSNSTIRCKQGSILITVRILDS